jgi:proteasome lid subunit RPN8/RPN11
MSSPPAVRSPDDPSGSGLVIDAGVAAEMTAHCLRVFPEEGCGLLTGNGSTSRVVSCLPVRNEAASARLYALDPEDHLRADREAEAAGLEIIGVFHSHTHTDAYPSATDIEMAPDPAWHYVLVSLRAEVPSIRSFRIANQVVEEEPLVFG